MNILTSLSLNRINDQLRALKSWSQYSVFSFNSRKDIFDFLDKKYYLYRNIYIEKSIDEYQMDLISYVKENKNK